MGKLQEFGKNTRGNIAMIAAAAAIPLTVAVAGVFDASQYSRLKSNMQNASDAAVMAAARAKGLSWRKRRAVANQFFHANFQGVKTSKSLKGKLKGTFYKKEQRVILSYSASGKMQTIFSGLVPAFKDAIAVKSTVEISERTGFEPRLIKNRQMLVQNPGRT